MWKIFVLLFFSCFIYSIKSFDNDTVITIEPRFFFKELFQIWSLYFFRSKPVGSINPNNFSDYNATGSSKTLKNLSSVEMNDEHRRLFPCVLNRVNYWNYKSGTVKIPIVLQMDRPSEKDDNKVEMSSAVNSSSSSASESGTKKSEPKKCTFIFIYAKWCRFSMAAAPIFNGLGRIFPQLEFIALAINDFQEFKWNLHTSYVPRIKMYFGSKSVREFNGSDSDFDALVEFVYANTGQLPLLPAHQINEDYYGPISNQIEPTSNFWLVISWLLTILCTSYLIAITGRGRRAILAIIRCFK